MLIAYAGAEKRVRDIGPAPATRTGNYRGRKPGSRRPVFTAEDDAEIIRLYTDGATYEVIGEKIGQARTNVFRRCRVLGLPPRTGQWRNREGRR